LRSATATRWFQNFWRVLEKGYKVTHMWSMLFCVMCLLHVNVCCMLYYCKSGGGTWDTTLYTAWGVGSGSRDVDAWRANGLYVEDGGLQVPMTLEYDHVTSNGKAAAGPDPRIRYRIQIVMIRPIRVDHSKCLQVAVVHGIEFPGQGWRRPHIFWKFEGPVSQGPLWVFKWISHCWNSDQCICDFTKVSSHNML
jgi:hypothetical protein